MKNCLSFSIKEDIFLKNNYRKYKISRLAISLNRPYYRVKNRLISLKLIKSVQESKFIDSDEAEYILLEQGYTEQDIKKETGHRLVFNTSCFNFGMAIYSLDE